MLAYFNELFDGYSFLFEAKRLFLYFKQEFYKLNFYDYLILEANLIFLVLVFYLSCFLLKFFQNQKFWVQKLASITISLIIYTLAYVIKYFFKPYMGNVLQLLSIYFIIYVTFRDLFKRENTHNLLRYIIKIDFYSIFNWIFIILLSYNFIPKDPILHAGLFKIFIFGLFMLFMISIIISRQAVLKLINEKSNSRFKGLFELLYSANWLLIFLFLFMWLFQNPLLEKFQKCLISILFFTFVHIIAFGVKKLLFNKVKNSKNESQLIKIYNFANFLIELTVNPLISVCVFYVWGIDIIAFVIKLLGRKLALQLSLLAILIALLRTFIILLDVFMHAYMQNRNRALEFGKRFDMFVNILNGLFKILIYIIFLILLMLVFEVNPSILVSNFWVFTASLTFVFQSLMKDFAMGIIMMFEDTFYIGDEVEVADVIGEVEEVTLRVLKIRNREGALVSIPFNKVEIFANKNRGYICVLISLIVKNNSDISLVTQLLRNAGEQLALLPEYRNKIVKDDITVLGPLKLSAHGMEFEVRIKTLPTKIKPLRSAYYGICNELFVQSNIEFGNEFEHFKSIFQ